MVVTLPCVLLLVDFWPYRRWPAGAGDERRPIAALGRLVVEKLPMFALCAAVSAVTLIAQWRGGSVRTMAEVPSIWRAANSLVAYMIYLGHTIWPARLAVLYPHPGDSLPTGEVVAAAALVAIASALAVAAARRHAYFTVGWFWFIGTLVPVIGLVQVGEQALADRYTYIPLIGVFLAVVWGAAEAAGHFRLPRSLVCSCGAVVLVALALVARHQIGYWRDSLALWQRDLEVAAPSAVAYNSLGVALGERRRERESLEYFRQALALEPRDEEARMNLARTLYALDLHSQAQAEYEAALAVNPNNAVAHHNLGVLLGRAGHEREAIAHFEAALRTEPNDWRTHLSLSAALAKAGNEALAQRHLQAAIRGNPRLADQLRGQAANRAPDGAKPAPP
jgi:Flp pilus assembly protein TadD